MVDASSIGLIGPLVSAFAHEVRPLLGLLMIHTIFGSMIIPLLLSLIYFSSSQLFRSPIFWLVMFDVALGLSVAIWSDVTVVRLSSTLRIPSILMTDDIARCPT
jgi:hypothetical protein